MSDSDAKSSKKWYSEPQVIAAFIGAAALVIGAWIALFARQPLEDGFVQLTAQAVVRAETATAAMAQTGIASAFTSTPTPTDTPTSLPTATPTETPTSVPTAALTPTSTDTLTVQPTNTPTRTATATSTPIPSTPTNTPLPSAPTLDLQATLAVISVQQTQMAMQALQPTSTPTAIPTVVQRGYPCEATVYSEMNSTRLNVVRTQPNPALPVTNVVVSVGQDVIVRDISVSQEKTWYLIMEVDGQSIGWIDAGYLQLSPFCP